jgi:hypothetical protein
MKKFLPVGGVLTLVLVFIFVSNTDIYLKNGGLHRSNLKARLQKMEMQYETEFAKDFSNEEISNLKINVDSETVKIHSGNKFKVYIRHLIQPDQRPIVNWKNRTLTLNAFAKKAEYFTFRPKVEVTIPAEKKLSELTITNQNGKTNIDNFQIETAKLKLGDGSLSCQKLTSKTLKITAQSGEIRFNKVNLSSLNLENKKGDIDLAKLTTTKSSIIKNGNGDITLKKLTTPGLDLNTAMGKVQIYGKKQTRYKNGNKKATLKVQTNVGDIEVE